MNNLTNLWTLFKQMWLQKRKYIYLVFLINIIVVAVLSILALFGEKYGVRKYWQHNFVSITIYVDLAFCSIMCWQNEKINMSQTWHLISASEPLVYLINVFSSLIACAYFFVLQQLMNGILLMPTSGINAWIRASQGFLMFPGKYTTTEIFLYKLIFIALIIIFIYFFVSFVNFASKVIADFLPFKGTLWIKLLIIAILVIVAVYLGLIVTSHLDSFIMREQVIEYVDPLWIDNLIFLMVDILLGICNSILVKKFVEPRIVR